MIICISWSPYVHLIVQVDKLVASHPVMVFSKTTCPFCDKVKAMFAGLNVTVEYLELDKIGQFILGPFVVLLEQHLLPDEAFSIHIDFSLSDWTDCMVTTICHVRLSGRKYNQLRGGKLMTRTFLFSDIIVCQ